MAANDWLRGIFEQSLRTTKPAYEELRSELQALLERGVVSEQEASSALARLEQDERGKHTIARGRAERARQTSRAGRTEDRLERLLTPERKLGRVDGITVAVTRIELWTYRLTLRLEGLRNQHTDSLDAEFEEHWNAWESRWIQDRRAAEAEDVPPPEQPSVSRFSGLPLSVTDDVDTRYYYAASATGGPYPWRSEWHLEPGVPSSARLLRIALEERAPRSEVLEFDLPS